MDSSRGTLVKRLSMSKKYILSDNKDSLCRKLTKPKEYFIQQLENLSDIRCKTKIRNLSFDIMANDHI